MPAWERATDVHDQSTTSHTSTAATTAVTGPATAAQGSTVTDVELAITGMTCASCANRIERKLNKIDGVTATVNYATEKAKVTAPDGIAPDELVAAVHAAGYGARLPEPPPTVAEEPGGSGQRGESGADPVELRATQQRLLTSIVLSVPVIALAMVPAWQFT